MQRQRHTATSRSKQTAAPSSSPNPLTGPQPSRLSNPLSRKSSNSRLILFSALLSFIVLILLLAHTPEEFDANHSVFAGVHLFSRSYHVVHDSRFSAGTSPGVRSARAKLLSYDTQNFTLDRVPIRLVSGSVHYFRMLPSRWRPVLLHARLMGLNAIETYVPWNLHEQRPGKFRFSGMLDLRAFLEIAHEVGLVVLLRPGPYICSEWDLGGLPSYLLADDTMVLRSTHPAFMRAAMRYFDALADQIAPYIGKPIVGLQLENEYGAYGSEKRYMDAIKRAWERKGLTQRRLMLFTSDNGGIRSIRNGSPFDSTKVLKTINLESNIKERVGVLRTLQPNAPAMIGEFWSGWYDHWGEQHHERSGEDVVEQVRTVLLDAGANVNLYMYFGGTNFGFMAGANIVGKHNYLADTTSYDYDGFITEYGAVRNDKFLPMQEMLRRFWRYLGEKEPFHATLAEPPKAPTLSAYAGPIALYESIAMFDVLDIVGDTRAFSRFPLPMEKMGGDYGFVLYRHNITKVEHPASNTKILQISGIRDFAYVIIDGAVTKTIDRNRELGPDGKVKEIHIPPGAERLDILVENRGRVNYGPFLHDRKGILGNVSINSEVLENFEGITMSFPQDHPFLRDVSGRAVIDRLRERMAGKDEHAPLYNSASPPTFFRGELSINPGSLAAFDGELPGTHCRIFGRGVLWVNGFNVGRFHTGVSGPQRSLYVPGALLREGRNEFVVLHSNMYLAREPPKVQMFAQPDFGMSTVFDSRTK